MEIVMITSKPCVLSDISNVQTVVASTTHTNRKGLENAKPLNTGTVKPPIASIRNTKTVAENRSPECKSPVRKTPVRKTPVLKTPASFNWELEIMACDKNDVADETAAVCYVRDIMTNLKRSERVHALGDYMATEGCSVDARMRLILCDWLVDAQLKFRISDESLFLSFNLLDRFLAKRNVLRDDLQTVGSACLRIAAKYQECYGPSIDEILAITLHSFTKQQFEKFETEIIILLDFDFTVATSLSFAQRFIKFATYKLKSDNDKEILRCLVHYFLEHAMCDYQLAIGLPSQIAAAVVCFAMFATKLISCQLQWDNDFAIGFGVGFTFAELLPQMLRLQQIVCQKKETTATSRKYRSAARKRVARHSFKNLDFAAIR